MPRHVAGGRKDFEAAAPPAVKRNYPVHGPWSQEEVVQWLMEKCPDWPRWRAVAATAIAIAMRFNSEPVPGGLVNIRVVEGGFQVEERTGQG